MARFSFTQIMRSSKLPLMVAGGMIVVVMFMVIVKDIPTTKDATIFGELVFKETVPSPTTYKPSQYEAIKAQEKQMEKEYLRYKEKKTQENPFFSLYKAERKQPPPQQEKKHALKNPPAPQKTHKTVPVKEESDGFFNVGNSDTPATTRFFEAVFREQQSIQDGKALRIVLKQTISTLNLVEGTILKGIPYLGNSNRLHIKITAAIVGDKIIPITLHCFDPEDCIEGLYHDELAIQMEAHTKSRVLDEALNIVSNDDSKILQQGKRLVQRFADLIQGHNKSIIVEKGRTVLVALPAPEEQEDNT